MAIPREVNGVMNIIITLDRQSNKKGDTKCNQQDNVDNQQYNYLQFINETRMIVLGLSFFFFLFLIFFCVFFFWALFFFQYYSVRAFVLFGSRLMRDMTQK